jgi:hypothetical protein
MIKCGVIKIVSGGQTGVDRAALDAALALGVRRGGWCPRGRLAEDGRLAARYPLRETPLSDYAQRTEWNVRDSDGTLLLCVGTPKGGTRLTLALARRLGKPFLVLAPLADRTTVGKALAWIGGNKIKTMNVAGPRESSCPGIYGRARVFMEAVLRGGPWPSTAVSAAPPRHFRLARSRRLLPRGEEKTAGLKFDGKEEDE